MFKKRTNYKAMWESLKKEIDRTIQIHDHNPLGYDPSDFTNEKYEGEINGYRNILSWMKAKEKQS